MMIPISKHSFDLENLQDEGSHLGGSQLHIPSPQWLHLSHWRNNIYKGNERLIRRPNNPVLKKYFIYSNHRHGMYEHEIIRLS
jgi:hypothetical protein